MIKNTKIKIKKKSYTLKAQSYRAMFLFEEITEKSVADIKSLQDQITYIYCILKVSNKDFGYDLEGFFDILDEEDNNIMVEFAKLASSKK